MHTFPKIPNIKLILTNKDDGTSESFDTWKSMEKFLLEVLDKSIYSAWLGTELFEREAYEDHAQWFHDQPKDVVEEIIEENGWSLERKAA